MVKTVVGEEIRLQLAEDHLAQSAIPAQVYLLSPFFFLNVHVTFFQIRIFNFKVYSL